MLFLLDVGSHLLCYLFHSFDCGVAVFLVDVFQLNHLHAVMTAYDLHRRWDLLAQLAVGYHVEVGSGVAHWKLLKQIGE